MGWNLLHLGGVSDGFELRVSGASHCGSVMGVSLAYGKGIRGSFIVRSLGRADDGAVEINVESDFVAFAVCEGVGSVEGGFDGRSDGVLDAGGGRVSKYGLLVSFLRLSWGWDRRRYILILGVEHGVVGVDDCFRLGLFDGDVDLGARGAN